MYRIDFVSEKQFLKETNGYVLNIELEDGRNQYYYLNNEDLPIKLIENFEECLVGFKKCKLEDIQYIVSGLNHNLKNIKNFN